jgi:hypothetical protein
LRLRSAGSCFARIAVHEYRQNEADYGIATVKQKLGPGSSSAATSIARRAISDSARNAVVVWMREQRRQMLRVTSADVRQFLVDEKILPTVDADGKALPLPSTKAVCRALNTWGLFWHKIAGKKFL